MTAADPRTPGPRDVRRERLIGLLVLGIAAVLLVSSVTWFTSGQTVVGVGQLVLALLLVGAGGFVYRRSQRP